MGRRTLFRSLPFLLAVSLPTLPAPAQMMVQTSCTGRTIRIALPQDPLPPQDQACCKGLCHGGHDRRKRGGHRPG